MTVVKLLQLDNNTWNHLTLCKQMINNKLNYLCQIETLETIYLSANKISSGSF